MDVSADVTPDVTRDATGDAADVADVLADVTADVVTDVPRDIPVDTGCAAGTTLCAGACVNTMASLAHCGGCGMACTITHGTAACVSGACVPSSCDTGYTVVRGACVIPVPPRALSPLSTSMVSGNRPIFRWSADAATDSLRIRIATTRAFTGSTIVDEALTGTSFMPSITLPRGVVYWRFSGRVGSVSVESPIYELVIPNVSATRTSNNLRGLLNDVNGDGLADVIARAPGSQSVVVFHGATGGLSRTPSVTLSPVMVGEFSNGLGFVGDVNGDGYGDVVVGRRSQDEAYVFLGSAMGLNGTSSLTRITNPGAGTAVTGFGGRVTGIGDVNCDGYNDVAIGEATGGDDQQRPGARLFGLGDGVERHGEPDDRRAADVDGGQQRHGLWRIPRRHVRRERRRVQRPDRGLAPAAAGACDRVSGVCDGLSDDALGDADHGRYVGRELRRAHRHGRSEQRRGLRRAREQHGQQQPRRGRHAVFRQRERAERVGERDAPSGAVAFGAGKILGDANGDGISDIVVGAPGLTTADTHQISLYYGGAMGALGPASLTIPLALQDFGSGFAQ